MTTAAEIRAWRAEHADEVRAAVAEAPPLPDAAIGLLRASGFPVRRRQEDRGAA